MKRQGLRYEADGHPPVQLAVGLGLQLAVSNIFSIVMIVAIVFRAGGAEEHLPWAIFASVLACGVATALQAVRVGRIGAGYMLIHGSAGTFVAVSVTALAEGGPAMLATLAIVSGLVQVAISRQLSWVRKILTPVVTGTIVMLLSVTVIPILLRAFQQVPPGVSATAITVGGCTTLLTIVLIVLWGTDSIRQWATALGVVAGSVAAASFGAYDTMAVAQASWIGTPPGAPLKLDLQFGPEFWAILPAFLFLTLVASTKSVGVAVAIQRVSWRGSRAVDFRSVQGTLAAEGTGNVLAGLLGTVINTPYPSAIAAAEVTRVAARSVGLAAGVSLIVFAFLPKVTATIAAVPTAVAAASIIVVMVLLFVVGMREVVKNARGVRDGLIAGVAFWTGTAFEFDLVYPEYFAEFAGGMLTNGMTAGGLTAIVLTLLLHLGTPRARRFKGRLDMAELPRIREFLGTFASGSGLEPVRRRMEAATEETLLTLVQSRVPGQDEDAAAGTGGDDGSAAPALLLTARKEDDTAVLEFIAGTERQIGDINMQDRIALLGETSDELHPPEREMSLRLLHHLASSVRHQQFHSIDVVTLRVSPRA